jgi:hypothetical protein
MNAKVANEVKKHFKIADSTISLSGGAKKWVCTGCKKVITGSATKLKAHLLAIPGHGVSALLPMVGDAWWGVSRASEGGS